LHGGFVPACQLLIGSQFHPDSQIPNLPARFERKQIHELTNNRQRITTSNVQEQIQVQASRPKAGSRAGTGKNQKQNSIVSVSYGGSKKFQ
jgi:hypothetical protein